jgi:TM2 domain-containing membrane protein YozV
MEALLSFFLPGLGQMCQKRVGSGIAWLLGTMIGYLIFFIPGLVLHIACVVDAAWHNEA